MVDPKGYEITGRFPFVMIQDYKANMQSFKQQLLYLLAFIFLTLFLYNNTSAQQYKCSRVTDGDTITVIDNGQKHTIRLVGIDAPEKSRGKHKPGQPFSQAATKHLAGLVLNKHVNIVSYGTDRYGRTLGVVYPIHFD